MRNSSIPITSKLIISSANRGWTGLSAELRSYSAGTLEAVAPQLDTEITIDVFGDSPAVVTCHDGESLSTVVTEGGMVWIWPAGARKELLSFSARLSGLLHIRLPATQFSALGLDGFLDRKTSVFPRCKQGFQDPFSAGSSSGRAADSIRVVAGVGRASRRDVVLTAGGGDEQT